MISKSLNFYKKLANEVASDSHINIARLKWSVDEEKFREILLDYHNTVDFTPPPINVDKTLNSLTYLKSYIYEYSMLGEDRINNTSFLPHFFSEIFYREGNIFPRLIVDKEENLVFIYKHDTAGIPPIYSALKNFFKDTINIDFSLESYPRKTLSNLLEDRINAANEFYIIENGDFLDKLMSTFLDKISVLSFQNFIDQKILVQIEADKQTLYPVAPPRITEAWRKVRLALPEPEINFSGPTDMAKQFYYDTTFKLEQYAVDGLLSANEGDVVIDAGACFGDTAIYFSRKIGPKGHVHSFEPIPDTFIKLQQNLVNNKACHNVSTVPSALSDHCNDLIFLDRASGSYIVNPEDVDYYEKRGMAKDLVKIPCTTLDEYVRKNNLSKIDYLKCDLEGSDYAFLRGGFETIKKFRPKCGLTLYHRKRDIIDIPQILLKAHPDYKFYFRMDAEPVLFAQP